MCFSFTTVAFLILFSCNSFVTIFEIIFLAAHSDERPVGGEENGEGVGEKQIQAANSPTL